MAPALLALILSTALPVGAAFSGDPAASSLRYHVTHKLHQVAGESKEVESKAVLQEGGKVIAMVRVPAASFRSGDGNRDSHMQETLEVGKYPFVVFKGVAQLGADGEPPGGQVTIEGEVDFHGVKRPASVPLTIEIDSKGTVRAHGSFDVSLDAHHVERPSLLFVKIDDACRIDVDLLLQRVK